MLAGSLCILTRWHCYCAGLGYCALDFYGISSKKAVLEPIRLVHVHVHAQPLSCGHSLWPPWTIADKALLSMEFSRQEYWSGFPFPPPGDLPDPGIELEILEALPLAGRCYTTDWDIWEALHKKYMSLKQHRHLHRGGIFEVTIFILILSQFGYTSDWHDIALKEMGIIAFSHIFFFFFFYKRAFEVHILQISFIHHHQNTQSLFHFSVKLNFYPKENILCLHCFSCVSNLHRL